MRSKILVLLCCVICAHFFIFVSTFAPFNSSITNSPITHSQVLYKNFLSNDSRTTTTSTPQQETKITPYERLASSFTTPFEQPLFSNFTEVETIRYACQNPTYPFKYKPPTGRSLGIPPNSHVKILMWQVPTYAFAIRGEKFKDVWFKYPPILTTFFKAQHRKFDSNKVWPEGMAPFWYANFTSSFYTCKDKNITYEFVNYTHYEQAKIVFVPYSFTLARTSFEIDPDMLPPKLNNGQKYVLFYDHESVYNYPYAASTSFLSYFDLTMGHPEKLYDLFFPPFYSQWTPSKINKLFFSPLQNKTAAAPITWIASNCNAKNGRMEFVKELMSLIPVHSYGKCLHNIDISNAMKEKYPGKNRWLSNWETMKCDILSNYYFALALENSNCLDYVTEKVYDAIEAGTVPIYMGAPNIENFVPENSTIIVSKFSSTRELVKHIEFLMNNPSEYNKYHSWRKDFKTSKMMKDIIQRRKNPGKFCLIVNK